MHVDCDVITAGAPAAPGCETVKLG